MEEDVLADVEEVAVVVEADLAMSSGIAGITFITEHYFFLNT